MRPGTWGHSSVVEQVSLCKAVTHRKKECMNKMAKARKVCLGLFRWFRRIESHGPNKLKQW